MEFRNEKIQELFRQLDRRLDEHLNAKSNACLEEHSDDPNGFYECLNDSTSGLRENYYKLQGLSLLADMKEKECSPTAGDYQQCIDRVAGDVTSQMNELLGNLE